MEVGDFLLLEGVLVTQVHNPCALTLTLTPIMTLTPDSALLLAVHFWNAVCMCHTYELHHLCARYPSEHTGTTPCALPEFDLHVPFTHSCHRYTESCSAPIVCCCAYGSEWLRR